MEQWTSTNDTRVAAVMGTLGVVVRLHRTFRERTGVTVTRFHLSLSNVERDISTKKVLGRWERGWLERDDPAHAFLTGMRVQENRSCVLDLANKGTRIRLMRVPGTEIWQYVRDPAAGGLPGYFGQKDLIETGDVKMVAALGLVGIPLLAIHGTRGSYQFVLPRWGPPRAGGPAEDGMALIAAWRRNKAEIPWSHPFAQGARTLFNRDRLLDAVNRDLPLILVEKPRSVKAALVRADATNEAWDRVKEAFDG